MAVCDRDWLSSLRVVGRDYIFKLMSPEFLASLFETRKRYFLHGEPSEIGKGKTVFFVAKFPKAQKIYPEYTLVGEGRVKDVYRVPPSDKDFAFAARNDWNFVIDLDLVKRYPGDLQGNAIFSQSILKKLSGQRPFGVELSSEESKMIKQKLDSFINGV